MGALFVLSSLVLHEAQVVGFLTLKRLLGEPPPPPQGFSDLKLKLAAPAVQLLMLIE